MQLPHNRFLRRGVAAGVALLASGLLAGTSFAATQPPDAPHLPPGFSKTFTSRSSTPAGCASTS